MLCDNCTQEYCDDRGKCEIIYCTAYKTEPKQTNADRIRAMTDEELAKEYDNRIYCGGCPVREKCDKTLDLCDTLLLEWLKQPAE